MPRRPRTVLPGVPLHLIQRGNNRQNCFTTVGDHLRYRGWLEDYAVETGCRIHAYVLMTNHIHLLLSADHHEAPSKLMKAVGQRYAQYYNRRHERSGTLWEGRYRSCLVQTETYLLICQRYIELNPVRAGMVEHPADYRWSSYRANAQAARDPLVTPHSVYLGLGQSAASRQEAYRQLFGSDLDPALLAQIRQANKSNLVLGNPHFTAEISSTLGRRVAPGKPGRPKKLAK